MKRLKTLEEWKEIGRQMKLIRAYYFWKLFPLLDGIPKKYKKAGSSFDHQYGKLKSDLEELFAKEYPEDFDTHVFYGYSEMHTVDDLELEEKAQGRIISKLDWERLHDPTVNEVKLRFYSEGELHHYFGDVPDDHIVEITFKKSEQDGGISHE